ncbi:MAG: hypothetical protein AAF921_12725 [Cyanobacteria bacterium P01_D01_bin.44]
MPTCGHKSSNPEDLYSCDYIDDPHYGNIYFPTAATTLKHLGISGITANSTKQDVIDILGEPTKIGGGITHREIGCISPWIKYHRPDCQLNFEFQEDKGIRMISVLEPGWEPGQ